MIYLSGILFMKGVIIDMNYYEEIKNKIIDNEIYEKVKNYSKERHRVITYYEIGSLLNEAGGKYGDNIIGEYADRLVNEVGIKYNKRTLFRMKQFYTLFNNLKVSPLATQLSWSHYTELLSIKDMNKLMYYINIASYNNLSKRELRERIKSMEYERLPNRTKLKLVTKEDMTLIDNIKCPIRIKNMYDTNNISEKLLKELILNNIESFMNELGEGYCYIGNEYKIMLGYVNNYIDILLFNIKYNCYVVVELKVTELKKEHIGQIQVYMNYIDENVKTIYHDKTIGIIVAKYNNKFVIRYSSNPKVICTEFELV